MDKQEIVDKAKLIGTYKASIADYKDVCSIVIRGAELRAKAAELDDICKKLEIPKVVKDTVRKSVREGGKPSRNKANSHQEGRATRIGSVKA